MGMFDDGGSPVLEDISFLSRSSNRIEVLDALILKPRSTRDLRQATETSKPTLNRILNEFDERSWARRTVDGHHEATPQGEHVLVQFQSLSRSMEAIRNLGDNLGVLPAEEMTIGADGELIVGLDLFDDAAIKQRPPVAQGVGRTELIESFRESSTINILTDMAPPRIIGDILQDRTVGGALTGNIICTDALIEHLRNHPEHPPRWSEVIEAGIQLYRYDGALPANIDVYDDSTLIWGSKGEMRQRVIISQNDGVELWALDVIERYRRQAELLEPDTFR